MRAISHFHLFLILNVLVLSVGAGPGPMGDAKPVGESLVRKAKFEEAGVVFKRLNLPAETSLATVPIAQWEPMSESEIKNGSRLDPETTSCSGTFVSDQRHLLTASHCLSYCRNKVNGKLRCYLNIGGVGVPVTVLVKNNCQYKFPSEPTGSITKKDIAENEDRCRSAIDLALVLPDPVVALEKVPFKCLQLASRAPAERLKDSVIRLGYGHATHRDQGPNSDGKSLQASMGEISDGKTCVLKDINSKKSGLAKKDLGRRFSLSKISEEEIKSQGLVFMTADAIGGNSGGSIINTRGELVGVMNGVAKLESGASINNRDSECAGATIFTDIAKFKELAETIAPGMVSEKSLRCEKHAIGSAGAESRSATQSNEKATHR